MHQVGFLYDRIGDSLIIVGLIAGLLAAQNSSCESIMRSISTLKLAAGLPEVLARQASNAPTVLLYCVALVAAAVSRMLMTVLLPAPAAAADRSCRRLGTPHRWFACHPLTKD